MGADNDENGHKKSKKNWVLKNTIEEITHTMTCM
jgi:hypothetical protein